MSKILHNIFIRILRLLVITVGCLIAIVLLIPMMLMHLVIGLFVYILMGVNWIDVAMSDKLQFWPSYYFYEFADKYLVERS